MTLAQWSTTPATNASAATGVNWAEGQAPSTVNNSARQEMTDVADWYRNSAEWIDRNDAVAFSSGTKVTFTSQDVTSVYGVGRRIFTTSSAPGTLYGRITASSTSGSDTVVTIAWDSTAVLVNEAISNVAVGIVSGSTNSSLYFSSVDGLPTLSSSDRGTIIQQGSTDGFTALTPGTAGKVLQSNGSTSNLTYSNVRSTVTPVTSTGGAATINLALSDVFSHTMTEDTTYTFSNFGSTSLNTGFKFFLTNASTGKTPTWPGSVIWGNGTEPTLTTANEKNVLVFESIDGGTVVYGALAIGDAS